MLTTKKLSVSPSAKQNGIYQIYVFEHTLLSIADLLDKKYHRWLVVFGTIKIPWPPAAPPPKASQAPAAEVLEVPKKICRTELHIVIVMELVI